MPIQKKPLLAAVIFFFLLVSSFGCLQQAKEPKLNKLTIAFQSWVGYGPLYLAQEKGFFKEQGLELDFIDEQLDSARSDAFKAGMLDCEAGTIDLLVSKRAQGVAVVAVLELDRSFGSDAIVATEDIKNLEDLIGKKVAFARDDVGETFISYLFYKNGLPLNKITIIPKGVEDVAGAFLNKEANAVATWEPWVSQALKRPGSHVLVSSKDYPGIIIDTLNVREDIVNNKPQLIKGLMRGWFKAVQYSREHPLEASQMIAKHYKISPENYQKNIQGLTWIDYKQQADPTQYNQWQDVFNTIAEIKFNNQRISKKPTAENAINKALLKGLYENIH